MSIREYIAAVFDNKYLLAKILRLTTIKGIESDLRFLFEQSFFNQTSKVPETEVDNRTDLKLPTDPISLIEIKCYDGVLATKDTQETIKKDFLTLSQNKSASKKIFVYFGLYGKTQAPCCKTPYVVSNRLLEIKNEIEKLHELAKEQGIEISAHEYINKALSDRILYCVWFHLK